MGNIREFDAPISSLAPNETAVTSTKELGNAQQSDANATGRVFGNVLADAGQVLQARQKVIGDKEVSTGAASYATMMLNNSDEWNATLKNADPNDSDTANRFLSTKKQELEDWAATFTTDAGKKWANDKVVQAYTSLSTSTHSDMSQIAGYAAVNNLNTYGAGQANFAHDNPEQVDSILAGVDADIPALIPGGADAAAAVKARTESALQIKQNVLQYAIAGMIDKNAAGFLKSFDNGDFKKYADQGLIDPTTYANARAQAVARIAYNDNQDKTAKAAQIAADKATAGKAEGALYTSTFGADGRQAVTPGYFEGVKAYMAMPGHDDTTGKVMWDYGVAIRDKAAKPLATTDDAATDADFAARWNLPEGDPKRLTATQVQKAIIDKKLTETRGNLYLSAIKPLATASDPITLSASHDLYDNALHSFDAPTYAKNGKDPTPAEAATEAEYKNWVVPQYLAGKAAGKTDAELLTPGSPDYLPGKFNPKQTDLSKQPLLYPPGSRAPAGAVPGPASTLQVPPKSLPLNPDGTIPLGAFLPGKPGGTVSPNSTLGGAAAPAATVQPASFQPVTHTPPTADQTAAISATDFQEPIGSGKLDPAVEAKFAGKTVPISIKANNMGAISIVGSGNSWVEGLPGYVGKVARPANEGGYYAKFATPEAGVHAASELLKRYGAAGTDTATAIVKKWSADPAAWTQYANAISKYTGFPPDAKLDLTQPAIRKAVLMAQSAFESGAGKPTYNEAVFDAGVA